VVTAAATQLAEIVCFKKKKMREWSYDEKSKWELVYFW